MDMVVKGEDEMDLEECQEMDIEEKELVKKIEE